MMKRCNYCDFTTKKGSTMSMHVSMKHCLTKKHRCPECIQQFAQKTQLQHHFVNNHCPADIPCGFSGCDFLFKNITTQKMHYVRCHLKDKLLYTSSSMKGFKTCLTCNIFLKRANMMYHLAQCSTESPFCTNVTAMEKKIFDAGIFDAGVDELAGMSDNEDEFLGAGGMEEAAAGSMGFDAGIDELAGMSDNDDEFWGAAGGMEESAGRMEEEEDLEGLICRVLSY